MKFQHSKRQPRTIALFHTLIGSVLPMAMALSATAQKEYYWTSPVAKETTPPFILKKIQESPWRGGLEPAIDVPNPVKCQVLQGSIPRDLKGTFFRNGPGRIRAGNTLYGHWFDGDGYVVKLSFNGKSNEATLQARYVQTERFKREGDGQGGLKVPGAWSAARNGSWLANLFRKPGNPANTSCRVVKREDGSSVLLALAEGGPPHSLDPVTLETLGMYDYGSPEEFGTTQDMASAHPSECPETGEMYTCGIRLGVSSAWPSLAELKVFKFVPGKNGSYKLHALTTLEMPHVSFVHDMAISRSHVVFVMPPYQTSGKELISSLFTVKPLGQRFAWDENGKTRIVVLRRSDLSVAVDTTIDEYVSAYHFINAYDVEDEVVKVQLALHNGPREGVESVFKNMYGEVFTEQQRCHLATILIKKDGSVTLDKEGPKDASSFELPTVNPNYVGKKERHVFTNAAYPRSAELINTVERLDLEKNSLDRASFGPYGFAMEPVVIPRGNSDNELDAYVLTLVYNAQEHVTDCVILRAANLSAGPLATVRMPAHIPYGFHGTWSSELFL